MELGCAEEQRRKIPIFSEIVEKCLQGFLMAFKNWQKNFNCPPPFFKPRYCASLLWMITHFFAKRMSQNIGGVFAKINLAFLFKSPFPNLILNPLATRRDIRA